jgi:hypothetical protein
MYQNSLVKKEDQDLQVSIQTTLEKTVSVIFLLKILSIK